MSDENGKRSGVLRVAYKDMPVDFDLTEKSVGQIEQLIDGLLSRGWTAPPVARGGFGGRPPMPKTKPVYDDEGNPMCPTHRKPLRQFKRDDGTSWWSCPAKAGDGEKANKNGYCAMNFDV